MTLSVRSSTASGAVMLTSIRGIFSKSMSVITGLDFAARGQFVPDAVDQVLHLATGIVGRHTVKETPLA